MAAPHLCPAPWGAPPSPHPPQVLPGVPKPCLSLRDLQWQQQRSKGTFPELHLTPEVGRGYREVPPAPQALPLHCPTACACWRSDLSLPARTPGERGDGGAGAGVGTARPRTEAEISSRSGSPTVKTRTPGRATERFTVLEVALRCGSKINSRKKGLSELHRNPAREAARQASGTDRRSPGACGSWQSFAPFPFFPSTAPETCARASARGVDGGKKYAGCPLLPPGYRGLQQYPSG